MSNKLKVEELEEVSLVYEGAGLDVPILITKSKGKKQMKNKSFVAKIFKKKTKAEDEKPKEEEAQKAGEIDAIIAKLPEEEQAILLDALAMGKEDPAMDEEEAQKMEDEEEAMKEDGEESQAVIVEVPADKTPEQALSEAAMAIENKSAKKSAREIKLEKRIAELEKTNEKALIVSQLEKAGAVAAGMNTVEMADLYIETKNAIGKSKADKLLKSWKSTGAIVKESDLFGKVSKSFGGEPEQSAISQINKKVESLLQKSGGKMDHKQAMEHVIKANPALYDQYSEELRDRATGNTRRVY